MTTPTHPKRPDARPVCISKGELADRYFPNRTHHGACNGLSYYIDRCTELNVRLRRCGYHTGQRLLTPQQVSLIYEYLGEP